MTVVLQIALLWIAIQSRLERNDRLETAYCAGM